MKNCLNWTINNIHFLPCPGLLYPVSPTKLVEEEHRTESAPPAPVITAEHNSSHALNSSDFIDSIIQEATKSGNNPPPRFIKEVKEEFSIPEVNIRGHKNTSAEASGENTILLGAFDITDIATDKDPFEDFDIVIQEVADPNEEVPTSKEVQEVFKSPVSSLSLPAVATKLAEDLDKGHQDFSLEKEKEEDGTPVIDLSQLDIFNDFKDIVFNDEDISLFETNKEKRNPFRTLSLDNNSSVVCNKTSEVFYLSNTFEFQPLDLGAAKKQSGEIKSASVLNIPPAQFTVVDYDQVDEIIKEHKEDKFHIDLTDLFVDAPAPSSTEPTEIR